MIRLAIPIILIAVAVGGICVRNRLIRIALWLLSLPPLWFSFQALNRISTYKFRVEMHDMFFLSAAFAPVVGCIAGEIIMIIRRKHITTRAQESVAGYVAQGAPPPPKP